MRGTTIAMLALVALGAACAGSKESQREEQPETTETTTSQKPEAPREGVVAQVDEQRLMLETPQATTAAAGEPEIYERTTRTLVEKNGQEVGWDALTEGDAVRVTWDAGIFGPDRVARVEVLSGEEADRIRNEVQNPEATSPDAGSIGEPGSMQPRPVEPAAPPSTPGETPESAPPSTTPPSSGAQPF